MNFGIFYHGTKIGASGSPKAILGAIGFHFKRGKDQK
jgi:hypothetical protein